MSHSERKRMVKRDHPKLSISRQCEVLSISRSSVYHVPKPTSPKTLDLMRHMDETFMKYPFYGSRQMTTHLRRQAFK